MLNYVDLKDVTKPLEELAVLIQQGHDDIELSHSSAVMGVKEALVVANDYDIGKYHPDVYVKFPDHLQVIDNNRIVGFVKR